MNKDDFFYLGKVLKTYGNKGHLMVFLDVDVPGNYINLDAAFIGIGDERIPYIIEEIELKPKNIGVIRFMDIHTLEDAEVFVGRELYLPLTLLPALKGNRFYYHEVTGFTVIDKHHGNIGILRSVLDLPRQSLMQIQHGQKEILVPLIDEILVKVDREKRELHINAPEGLIEIYL